MKNTSKNLPMKMGGKLGKVASKANPYPALADAVNEIVTATKEYLIVAEQEETKREVIKANRDMALKRIDNFKEIILVYMDKSFQERDKAIIKQFEVIDYALENGNIEALNSALGSIVATIKTSPLADFAKFQQQFNDPENLIEI